MASGSVFVTQAANEGELVPTTGTIGANNDAVTVSASGQTWASVQFVIDAVLNVTSLQPEYSIDGKNWISAPYSRRIDASSANPSVAALVSPAASAQTWETPLPGDCMQFRVRATGTPGAAGSVTVQGGKLYTPGVPVVAVLYDATSTVAGALDSGTITMSGWTVAEHTFTGTGGTPSFTIKEVDDAGTALAALVTGAASFAGGLGAGTTIGGTAGLAAATAQIPLPKRVDYAAGAVASVTNRIRVVARR